MTLCSTALCQMTDSKLCAIMLFSSAKPKSWKNFLKMYHFYPNAGREFSPHAWKKKQGPRNSSISIKDFSGNPIRHLSKGIRMDFFGDCSWYYAKHYSMYYTWFSLEMSLECNLGIRMKLYLGTFEDFFRCLQYFRSEYLQEFNNSIFAKDTSKVCSKIRSRIFLKIHPNISHWNPRPFQNSS